MMDAAQLIAQDLSINRSRVEAALALFSEGGTVPFIARYRKEKTGELDEIQLRQIAEKHAYLSDLSARKKTILDVIRKQKALTPALQAKIDQCRSKTELEDLYLPYKPKRRTRATIAKEKGLEPLANEIVRLNAQQKSVADIDAIAQPYLNDTVSTLAEALQGAADILAETMAEQATLRAYIRQFFLKKGIFTSKIKAGYPEGSTKYEMYRSYQNAVNKIAPHNLLALLRGEKEGILKLSLSFDDTEILRYLLASQLQASGPTLREFYSALVKDGFNRLMKTSLTNEIIAEKKAWADEESIQTFAENLRNLLLSAPAGMQPTLGVDPGFRTGCKVAAISETGQFLEYEAIYPHSGQGRRLDAIKILNRMIDDHKIEFIGIGNGTASRETNDFIAEVLASRDQKPVTVIVNESGASIYSASAVAIAEFPELDITIRGAISIARRLQDPLAELVKLDPKSIGVGQYQHDVDQKRLKQKLDDTVESCVNYVGVDLNTASVELLQYVSGVSKTIANNIVSFRNEIGQFEDRKTLLKVGKLGPKAYEQSAGFLRIRNGRNPLDNTAVHPESYGLVQTMAKDAGIPLVEISQAEEKIKQIDLKRYVTPTVGEPTLQDILNELEKPGRDPREQFTYALFAEGIHDLKDLAEGMVLEGVITNVANFGAFVDIGVHQDGLVHISQMADQFVKDPKEVVQVGQVVKVRVLEVQEKLKRIGLSMRSSDQKNMRSGPNSPAHSKPNTTKKIKKRHTETASDKKATAHNTGKPIRKGEKKRTSNSLSPEITKKQKEPLLDAENLRKRFNQRRP